MSLGAWLCVFAAKLKARFAQDKENREFDDEVHAHLQLLTEQYLRQGMPAEQARLAARRQFGNPSLVRERHREARSFLSLSAIWRDVRFGARQLGRRPSALQRLEVDLLVAYPQELRVAPATAR